MRKIVDFRQVYQKIIPPFQAGDRKGQAASVTSLSPWNLYWGLLQKLFHYMFCQELQYFRTVSFNRWNFEINNLWALSCLFHVSISYHYRLLSWSVIFKPDHTCIVFVVTSNWKSKNIYLKEKMHWPTSWFSIYLIFSSISLSCCFVGTSLIPASCADKANLLQSISSVSWSSLCTFSLWYFSCKIDDGINLSGKSPDVKYRLPIYQLDYKQGKSLNRDWVVWLFQRIRNQTWNIRSNKRDLKAIFLKNMPQEIGYFPTRYLAISHNRGN